MCVCAFVCAPVCTRVSWANNLCGRKGNELFADHRRQHVYVVAAFFKQFNLCCFSPYSKNARAKTECDGESEGEKEKERKRLRVKMKDSWEFEDSRSLCVQRHCCSLCLVRCYGVLSSRKVLGFFVVVVVSVHFVAILLQF